MDTLTKDEIALITSYSEETIARYRAVMRRAISIFTTDNSAPLFRGEVEDIKVNAEQATAAHWTLDCLKNATTKKLFIKSLQKALGEAAARSENRAVGFYNTLIINLI